MNMNSKISLCTIIVLLYVIVLLPSLVIAADKITGKELKRICENDKKLCVKLLQGITDGIIIGSTLGGLAMTEIFVDKKNKNYKKIYSKSKENSAFFLGFCMSRKLTKENYAEIFLDYIKNIRPDRGEDAAAAIMISAFRKNSPEPDCN